MRVLALDLSLTSTGWATNRQPVACGTFHPKKREVERLNEIVEWLDEKLEQEQPDVVVIEGYSFMSKGNAIVSIGEMGGVVRLFLHQSGRPYVEIAPSCRAKIATGKGNAKKELVLVEAVKRLGYSGASNDESDALWLLQAALHHYGLEGAVPLPNDHMEALNKVKWPVLEHLPF